MNESLASAEEHLSEDEIKRLQSLYDNTIKRIIHEYDQRDRDFIMYLTINGGLFIAIGFVLQHVRLSETRLWGFAGLAILIIG